LLLQFRSWINSIALAVTVGTNRVLTQTENDREFLAFFDDLERSLMIDGVHRPLRELQTSRNTNVFSRKREPWAANSLPVVLTPIKRISNLNLVCRSTMRPRCNKVLFPGCGWCGNRNSRDT
jgi:hypothetical protein